MVAGLLFMKQQGLAHHDVSLENIGMTSKTSVQIIDLGMAINVPGVGYYSPRESSTHRASVYLAPQRSSGKQAYVAPEVNIRSSDDYLSTIVHRGRHLTISLPNVTRW